MGKLAKYNYVDVSIRKMVRKHSEHLATKDFNNAAAVTHAFWHDGLTLKEQNVVQNMELQSFLLENDHETLRMNRFSMGNGGPSQLSAKAHPEKLPVGGGRIGLVRLPPSLHIPNPSQGKCPKAKWFQSGAQKFFSTRLWQP